MYKHQIKAKWSLTLTKKVIQEIEQIPSTDEDHEMQMKAPEKAIKGALTLR